MIELSRGMDSTTMAAHKEMLRVTNLVLATESFCLKRIGILSFLATLFRLEIRRIESVPLSLYSTC